MRLIDADALLEKIENPYQYREIARWVNDEPTVKPKLEWIPCSERLPKLEGMYIVRLDENQIAQNHSRVVCALWLDGVWQYEVLESYERAMPRGVIEPLEELTVIAWMPLPEAYKEDDDGKQEGGE